MDRSDEIARRAGAQRFRLRRAAIAADLTRLLGPSAPREPLAEAGEASAVAAEFDRAYATTEARAWARVARWWEDAQADDLADTVHRLANNLGAREVWLLIPGPDPQVVPITSDAPLDNPLGFAALGDHELRLLDRHVPAGLWLLRHAYHDPAATSYRWELEVWGTEPWLSAATRAFRGEG